MKKVSRKKWSQFIHRLTRHNQGRRPTAPSLNDLINAEIHKDIDDPSNQVITLLLTTQCGISGQPENRYWERLFYVGIFDQFNIYIC